METGGVFFAGVRYGVSPKKTPVATISLKRD